MKRIAFVLVALVGGMPLPGQSPAVPAKPVASAAVSTAPESSHEMNIRAYIELLRTDVKKGKAQIMGAVMQLDADQAADFLAEYGERLREAYPPRSFGTVFPFRRVFAVAHRAK